jgi:hypothetical protein
LTFDLGFSIVTIGPLEPALLLSLFTASLTAWPLGRGLASLTRAVKDRWRRRLYVGPIWLLSGIMLFFLPQAIVVGVYPFVHSEDGNAIVCLAIVWPMFVVPPVIGYAVALRGRGRLPHSPAGEAIDSRSMEAP